MATWASWSKFAGSQLFRIEAAPVNLASSGDPCVANVQRAELRAGYAEGT